MKGQLRIVEVIIAILMVIVAYVLLFSAPITLPDFESINDQFRAFNSLQTLDQNNELRVPVLQNNTLLISQKLQYLIPSNINYNVSICSSICIAPIINSTRVFSVDYIISGDVNNFNPQQVVIYMWS